MKLSRHDLERLTGWLENIEDACQNYGVWIEGYANVRVNEDNDVVRVEFDADTGNPILRGE